MRYLGKIVVVLAVLGLAAVGWGVLSLLRHGISARDRPTLLETLVARRLRQLAVPLRDRELQNPVEPTAEALTRARAHFADHCASCHGNDGRGRTALGQNLYPKAPDMTLSDTQRLSDGEIFAIIENGVRLTGMPAWAEAGPHDPTESWELVLFIRHLPQITPDEIAEMESLTPRSRKQFEEDEAIRRFLAGEGDAPEVSERGRKYEKESKR